MLEDGQPLVPLAQFVVQRGHADVERGQQVRHGIVRGPDAQPLEIHLTQPFGNAVPAPAIGDHATGRCQGQGQASARGHDLGGRRRQIVDRTLGPSREHLAAQVGIEQVDRADRDVAAQHVPVAGGDQQRA